MTRINITLTGERAEEYERRKERLEDTLGYDMSHPEAVGLMMNFDVNSDNPINSAKL